MFPCPLVRTLFKTTNEASETRTGSWRKLGEHTLDVTRLYTPSGLNGSYALTERFVQIPNNRRHEARRYHTAD